MNKIHYKQQKCSGDSLNCLHFGWNLKSPHRQNLEIGTTSFKQQKIWVANNFRLDIIEFPSSFSDHYYSEDLVP